VGDGAKQPSFRASCPACGNSEAQAQLNWSEHSLVYGELQYVLESWRWRCPNRCSGEMWFQTLHGSKGLDMHTMSQMPPGSVDHQEDYDGILEDEACEEAD